LDLFKIRLFLVKTLNLNLDCRRKPEHSGKNFFRQKPENFPPEQFLTGKSPSVATNSENFSVDKFFSGNLFGRKISGLASGRNFRDRKLLEFRFLVHLFR